MCFKEMVPTMLCPGLSLPLEMPAARIMSHDVGGDFISKEKVRSGLTVMRTGMGMPGV